MSYARWSDSHWYAYWDSSHSDPDIQKTQSLTFCALISFTEEELRADQEECLERLGKLDPEATEADMDEARYIMCSFVADVIWDRKHPRKDP